jgi:hypothetical protein
LSNLRLGFAIDSRRCQVLVLAGKLAAVAAVADGKIDDEYLFAHYLFPPSTQALNRKPLAGHILC